MAAPAEAHFSNVAWQKSRFATTKGHVCQLTRFHFEVIQAATRNTAWTTCGYYLETYLSESVSVDIPTLLGASTREWKSSGGKNTWHDFDVLLS